MDSKESYTINIKCRYTRSQNYYPSYVSQQGGRSEIELSTRRKWLSESDFVPVQLMRSWYAAKEGPEFWVKVYDDDKRAMDKIIIDV